MNTYFDGPAIIMINNVLYVGIMLEKYLVQQIIYPKVNFILIPFSLYEIL